MYRKVKQQVLGLLVQAGMPAEQAGFEINRCLARFTLSSELVMQFKIGPVNFTMNRNPVTHH